MSVFLVVYSIIAVVWLVGFIVAFFNFAYEASDALKRSKYNPTYLKDTHAAEAKNCTKIAGQCGWMAIGFFIWPITLVIGMMVMYNRLAGDVGLEPNGVKPISNIPGTGGQVKPQKSVGPTVTPREWRNEQGYPQNPQDRK